MPKGVELITHVVTAVVVVTTLSACGGEEPFAGSRIAPTGTPSASPTPVTTAPVGSRVVQGDTWRLAVPGNWEESRRTFEDHGELVRWTEPSPSGPARVVVSVVVETEPEVDLLEQSFRLEQRLREQEVDVLRSTVRQAGTQEPAVLVQWTENSRGDERRRQVWQLLARSASGSIVNVVGFAPVEEFASSPVAEVMGSLEVRG